MQGYQQTAPLSSPTLASHGEGLPEPEPSTPCTETLSRGCTHIHKQACPHLHKYTIRRTQTVKIKAFQMIKMPSPNILPSKSKKKKKSIIQLLQTRQTQLNSLKIILFLKSKLKCQALKTKMDD